MDVTIMDRRAKIAVERAGEIFHSPDTGASSRVPSNPWGFTSWFRGTVGVGQEAFAATLREHRLVVAKNRLTFIDENERIVVAKAEQVDLPPVIPSAIDAQEAVALKLLKRFLNLRYEGLPVKRPPSIYLTKRAGDVGYVPQGLTAQLFQLADSTAKIMRNHIAAGTRPRELNPSYAPDRINDRWPADDASGVKDMKILAEQLEYLTDRLEQMLLGPDRCLRLEPKDDDAAIEMDDYDVAFARLPTLAAEDFARHREVIGHFFEQNILPRERHHSGA